MFGNMEGVERVEEGKGMTHVNVPGRRRPRMAIIVILVLVSAARAWHGFEGVKGLNHLIMLNVGMFPRERSKDGW